MSHSEDHGHSGSENNGNNGNHYFYDASHNDLPIVNFTLNETNVLGSVTVVNQQGTNQSGDEITNSIMFTTSDSNENATLSLKAKLALYNIH